MRILMSNVAKLAIGTTLALTLVGCGSSGGQSADCAYYQDSALVLLDSYYELEATQVPKISVPDVAMGSGYKEVSDYDGQARKNKKLAQIQSDWSMRVLEAPEGCFSFSDIDKAIRTPKP